jgi:putative nucleotidyltransferase with HDIG domain
VVNVERIIENILEFPTLPTVYSSLVDVLADPSSTIQDVSRIIANDQASTSKILKIVNSPFYGFPGQIDTVSRAIVILGYNEINNLILTSYIMDFFSKKDSLLDFQPVDFWGHSIAVGIATKYLGAALGLTKQDNFFTAGILHDIGKLFFFEFAEDQFSKALEFSRKHRQTIQSAEWSVFGTDHAQIGALLTEKWGLPQSIVNALRYHETGIIPETPDKLVAAVHLGNILVRALELGYPGDDFISQPNKEALDILNLEPGILTKIVPDLLKDYEEISRILF